METGLHVLKLALNDHAAYCTAATSISDDSKFNSGTACNATTTKLHSLEKRSGERNEDGRFQVQLEEDGGGSTRQSWMEISSVWIMLHVE